MAQTNQFKIPRVRSDHKIISGSESIYPLEVEAELGHRT
jgi:hypothetical protein